jgi:SLT domain-containing protein
LVEIIGGFMKLVFTRVVTGAVRAFNSSINTINTIISNLKNVPFIGEPLKAVGLIPEMKIPKFAQGGIVSRPTVAMVGEGGQSEYIIPESKLKALYNQINSTMESQLQGLLAGYRNQGVSENNVKQQEQVLRSSREGEIENQLKRYLLVDQNNTNQTPDNYQLDYASLKSLAQLFPESIRPLLEEQERKMAAANKILLEAQERDRVATLDSVNARMAESAAAFQKTLEQQRQDQEKQANDTKAKLSSFFDKLDQMNPSITITTGPVLRFNNEDYVTVNDLRSAMEVTAKGILDSLRNPSTRISLGLV